MRGYNRRVATATFAAQYDSGFAAEIYRRRHNKKAGAMWTRALSIGLKRRQVGRDRIRKRRRRHGVTSARPVIEFFFSKTRGFFDGGDTDYGANTNSPDMDDQELKKNGGVHT